MSDTTLATTDKPSRQALAVPGRSKALKVTGKLAQAIERMIELGEPWDDAARSAGLTARAMRKALDRPHVLAFLRQRKQVFREAVSAANIHRLREIRDAANNMPAVHAVKLLDQIPDDNASGTKHLMPGFCVQIVNVQQVAEPAKPSVQVIDP